MKNGQIFAHKSTARGALDLEYLDETSRRKVSLRERADMDQQIGKKLKHFTDYASKETRGQVNAGGFLHHSIRINQDGTSTAPSQLSNVMRRFNERYHPNDSIGYAYGIHHDTAHLHAIEPVQAQEADGLHQIMVRARERPLGQNSRLPTEIGGGAIQTP